MDPILKQKITDKLRGYLNREPLENEIINGQNDANLMHWIAQDDAVVQRAQITAIGVATKVDTAAIEASVIADNSL